VPRIRKERVHGPYFDPSRRKPWNIHLVRADGRRSVVRFETEAAARAKAEEARTAAQGRTVTSAIVAYLDFKRPSLREGSLTTLSYRLHGFFHTAERDRLLRWIKPVTAAQLYAARVTETKTDTHRCVSTCPAATRPLPKSRVIQLCAEGDSNPHGVTH